MEIKKIYSLKELSEMVSKDLGLNLIENKYHVKTVFDGKNDNFTFTFNKEN